MKADIIDRHYLYKYKGINYIVVSIYRYLDKLHNKELERQLDLLNADISPEKAIDIIKTIYALSIRSPYSDANHTSLILKNEEQVHLLKLFRLQ